MKKGKVKCIIVTMIILASLCGCDQKVDTELYLPNDFRTQASPSMLNSAKVSKGNLETNMKYPLIPYFTNVQSYMIEKKRFEDNNLKYGAEFKRINVNVGSYVKKYDLLIEFSSEALDTRIKELKAAIKENEEEAAYLRKLSGADHSTDYSKEIKLADKQVEYNKELLKGVEKDYRSINIYAEEDGIVEYMDEDAQKGIAVINTPIIRTRQVCDTYYVEDETGKLKDFFKPGQTYDASASKLDDAFKLKCSKIEEPEDGQAGFPKICFQTIEAVEADYGILYVEMNGVKKENVMHLNRDFVYKRNGVDCVFTAGEDGLLEKRTVKLGELVEDEYIILDGLKENERVYKPGSWAETNEENKVDSDGQEDT